MKIRIIILRIHIGLFAILLNSFILLIGKHDEKECFLETEHNKNKTKRIQKIIMKIS